MGEVKDKIATLEQIKTLKDYIDEKEPSAQELSNLEDVSLSEVSDKDVLSWDAASEKWVNKKNSGGGGGSSDWEDIINKPNNLMYGSDDKTTIEGVVINNENIYSLEEQIIGKWMDKTLYKRTFLTTSPSSSAWVDWTDISNQIKEAGILVNNIIKMDAIIYGLADGKPVFIPLHVNYDMTFRFVILVYGDLLRGTVGNYGVSSPTYFTFEYIKEE